MFGLGTQELLLILIIVLIIFGAGKLPTIGTAIGQAIKNFKKSSSESEGQKEKLEAATKPEEPAKKV